MHRFRSIPAAFFITGIALILGTLIATAVQNSTDHGHNFASPGVRTAIGGVAVLGLIFIASGFVWIVASRRERRTAMKRSGESG